MSKLRHVNITHQARNTKLVHVMLHVETYLRKRERDDVGGCICFVLVARVGLIRSVLILSLWSAGLSNGHNNESLCPVICPVQAGLLRVISHIIYSVYASLHRYRQTQTVAMRSCTAAVLQALVPMHHIMTAALEAGLGALLCTNAVNSCSNSIHTTASVHWACIADCMTTL